MSISVPPPEYQFSGLFYNPEWWISTSTTSTGGLTQAVANTLYLRKTTTDSASALETFNAGIKSSSYDTITAGATQNMFSTQTANTNLFPNMGAGQTLKLGNQTTTQSVHCSYIDCNGNTINNANAPTTGALSIGNTQTSGILNLGTNVARTGAINIGGLGSTGKITLNRPLTVGYSIVPASGDIGSRELLVSGTFTSGGVGVSTNVFTLTAQPIGTFIYEFRFNFSTICLFTSSFSLVSATHNAGFSITSINTTTSDNYFKNIQVVANTPSVVDWYVVASSSVASTALTSCGVVRTRIG